MRYYDCVWRTSSRHTHRNTLATRTRLLPHVIEYIHDTVIDSERNSDIKHNSTKPRHGSLVEAAGAFRFPRLDEAVPRALVFRSFETLHSRFDDIDWCIAEYWGRSWKKNTLLQLHKRRLMIYLIIGKPTANNHFTM